ncbi:hypothetical protein BIFGAL_02559 [Bifidobacterium gallicum DSM 20093 = LMG 11596]|uniref:Uncharacterized protein n=1 Tax=Bifidobacterium gallicum DSM 20093 = LMG 11596 TaxID=561180 RepID=D1NS05_9BIFI|nr:hypothetical protein BIFGAL_02559 [Bifidobacterium gallicum DSM 20093 = LMG 11596]
MVKAGTCAVAVFRPSRCLDAGDVNVLDRSRLGKHHTKWFS